MASLERGLGTGSNNEVIKQLADYFADLIFNLVEVPVDEEIPMQKIRDKIILRGKEASYLEMFVGTSSGSGAKGIDVFKLS
jgi:hypothetical protein